jgi:AcrR family transcriptional regulator
MNSNKQDKRNSDQTRDRLISSGLNLLVKNGYHGAVTREIAMGAGVTEMTLFRHFRSKDELFAAAIVEIGKQGLSYIPEPSGDVEADLLQISASMVKEMSSNFVQLVRIIPEVEEHNEIKEQMDGLRDRFNAKFLSLINHYQSPGTAIGLTDDMACYMFLGPILFFCLSSAGTDSAFDSKQHVRFFLSGLRYEKE